MKITYSITDNELLDIYKDQWENHFDHNFPTLSREDLRRLRAEVSRVAEECINLWIGNFVHGDDNILGLMIEGGFLPYALETLENEINAEKEEKNKVANDQISKAIDLLAEHGYEVKKT